MNHDQPGIPAEAMELAARGQVIEAIKVTRQQTGLSLKDAKDRVDAYIRNPHGTPRFDRAKDAPTTSDIPEPALLALEQGQLIEAIKHTRKTTGLGLKDTKELVERYLEQNPGLHTRFKSASSAQFRRVAGKVILVLVLLSLFVLSYQYFFGLDH